MRAPRPLDARLDCGALAAHGTVMPHWRAAFDALMEA
jgi:dTDP-4-dehydrorhamnose reductase